MLGVNDSERLCHIVAAFAVAEQKDILSLSPILYMGVPLGQNAK